jgi:hypothetical protein
MGRGTRGVPFVLSGWQVGRRACSQGLELCKPTPWSAIKSSALAQFFFSLFEKHQSSYFQRHALLAVDCEWRKEAAYWKDHLFHLKRVESHVLAADQTGNHISGQSVHR